MGRLSQYPAKRNLIIAMVIRYEQAHGKPPSLREVAQEVGVSVATLHSYVDKLVRDGLVLHRPKSHRSLQATEKGRRLNEASIRLQARLDNINAPF